MPLLESCMKTDTPSCSNISVAIDISPPGTSMIESYWCSRSVPSIPSHSTPVICASAALLIPKLDDAPVSTNHSLLSIRSEEHTSELQSHSDLVCRLLLEK